METIQECCEQYWTSHGSSTTQSSSCKVTYLPSWKLSKTCRTLEVAPHKAAVVRSPTTHHENYPDMQDTAGEVETSSLGMYSCGPLHMDVQRQDDQLEPTYSSSVPIRDVALRTYRKQLTIKRGGEIGSGISVLIARHDNDDKKLIVSYLLSYRNQMKLCYKTKKLRWEPNSFSFTHQHI